MMVRIGIHDFEVRRLEVERSLLAVLGGCLIAVALLGGAAYPTLGELPLGAVLLAAAAVPRYLPATRELAVALGLWFFVTPALLTVGATRTVADVAIALGLFVVGAPSLDNLKARYLADGRRIER
jgi:hypothetical protein